MKEPKNIATKVSNHLLDRMEQVSSAFANMAGGEPFDQVAISREKQRKMYESLTPQDMFQLIGRHGKPAVEKYIQHMEQEHG